MPKDATDYTFTARAWCETDDDRDDLAIEDTFDHADDAADAAYDLMRQAKEQGRAVRRYGWTLIDGQRPGLPEAQSWECP